MSDFGYLVCLSCGRVFRGHRNYLVRRSVVGCAGCGFDRFEMH